MISFTHKNVLITGAGGGIGAATAKLFHSAGASVVLTDVNEQVLAPTVTALSVEAGSTKRMLALPLDITDPVACHSVAKKARDTFGAIDSVVNCAGIYVYREGLLADLTQLQWRRMLSINLDGCFNLSQAVIPHLSNNSSIVLIASVAASRGSLMHSSYAASKSGVIGLGRSLALELAPKTRVNTISPGLINTQMASAMVADRGDAVKDGIPLKRFGEAVEAAGVIAFLCSDLASYVNGETLNVNGGMYID
jgi:3-oxoacyl-[acyl-carrier protein] reductase